MEHRRLRAWGKQHDGIMGRQFGIVSYLCVPGLRCSFLLCTLFYALMQLIEHLFCAGHCSISKGDSRKQNRWKCFLVCVSTSFSELLGALTPTPGIWPPWVTLWGPLLQNPEMDQLPSLYSTKPSDGEPHLPHTEPQAQGLDSAFPCFCFLSLSLVIQIFQYLLGARCYELWMPRARRDHCLGWRWLIGPQSILPLIFSGHMAL